MKAKPGQLKFGWSKKENDIIFAWGGNGADKTDAAFLSSVLTVRTLGNKTLQQDLIERGYDITTIKFSIQKVTNPL